MATKKLHSNYQIRWKNYRRFEDTDWLTLTPLTVLLGANNGGKSSVLSPLLLLSQTLSSHDSEAPLVPFGPLIDLGNYRDFIHQHDTKRDLFFGLRFHSHEPKEKIKPVGTYAPGGIELTFTAGEQPQQVTLTKFEVSDIYNRTYFSRVAKDKHFELSGAITTSGMTEMERHAVHSAMPMNYMFSPSDVLYELDKKKEQDKETKTKAFSGDFSHYLKAIGYTQALIRDVFDNLSYVGPLRARLIPMRVQDEPICGML